MKTLFSLMAVALIAAGSAFGQSQSQIDAAIKQVAPPGSTGLTPLAYLANGVIGKNGQLIVNTTPTTGALVAGTTVTFAPAGGVYVWTDTPAQAQTINATTLNAVTGQFYTILITTSGTTSYTVTFGTNFTSIGTLATGTTTAIVYEVVFQFDGSKFREVSRTRQGSLVVTVPVVATTSTLPYAEGVVLYNWTPITSENLAIVPAGRAGAVIYLQIIGDASAARTTTFTTNVKSTGTLATGSSGATNSTATFVSDGTNWRETSRGTALTP